MGASGLLKDIAFFTTVADLLELPPSAAEVAFVGRSNAGKSSVINTLARRNRLAFVSKTPGRTQHLNFFSLGDGRFLVDLPGYGYAEVPGAMKRYWRGLLAEYLQTRVQLRGLVVVMDIRHPLTPLDMQMLEWFAPTGRPVLVLLTKADKLNRQQGIMQTREVTAALAGQPQISVQVFSATAKTGVEAAEKVLANWFAGQDGRSRR
jgi:GTP-binding protein